MKQLRRSIKKNGLPFSFNPNWKPAVGGTASKLRFVGGMLKTLKNGMRVEIFNGR